MKTALIIAALILLPALASAQAVATTAVNDRDLDLRTSVGAHQMLNRLRTAALSVCGAPDGSSSAYQAVVSHSACFKVAMDHAVASLGKPQVTALYAAPRAVDLAAN